MRSKKATDIQVGGNHYKDFSIQPIEFIHANNLGFIESSIIKYICRFRQKNGIEDLEKIKHCVDLLIQLEYGNNNDDENVKFVYVYDMLQVGYKFDRDFLTDNDTLKIVNQRSPLGLTVGDSLIDTSGNIVRVTESPFKEPKL